MGLLTLGGSIFALVLVNITWMDLMFNRISAYNPNVQFDEATKREFREFETLHLSIKRQAKKWLIVLEPQ